MANASAGAPARLSKTQVLLRGAAVAGGLADRLWAGF